MNDESNLRWGHASSPDAEAWHGMYETREEAITDGRQDYGGDDYWITSGHLVPLEAVLPDVDDIIDTMACRARTPEEIADASPRPGGGGE